MIRTAVGLICVPDDLSNALEAAEVERRRSEVRHWTRRRVWLWCNLPAITVHHKVSQSLVLPSCMMKYSPMGSYRQLIDSLISKEHPPEVFRTNAEHLL
jgi:hypothetical protein